MYSTFLPTTTVVPLAGCDADSKVSCIPSGSESFARTLIVTADPSSVAVAVSSKATGASSMFVIVMETEIVLDALDGSAAVTLTE